MTGRESTKKINFQNWLPKVFPCLIIALYFLLALFSYSWVDLNLTLTSNQLANQVLEWARGFSYFNRPLSAQIYLVFILLSFLVQIYCLFSSFVKKTKLKKLLLLSAIVILLATLAYPFLSHDIFSYLFDAKIIWHYDQNPYYHSPDEFSGDTWLRFMHWTHRTTPYGPIWLLYTLLPALVSFGRFVINFWGLKLLNGVAFFLTGYLLLKIFPKDKRVFAYWFFNPFLLIELLVNAHNDLLMIALFFLAYFLWQKKKRGFSVLAFLSSVATKFISGLAWPLIFFKNHSLWATGFIISLLLVLAWKVDSFQPWYFSWLFIALPLVKMTNFSWLVVFVFQALLLVLKYQSFLLTGSWEGTSFFTFFRVLLVGLAAFLLFFRGNKIVGRKLVKHLERS